MGKGNKPMKNDKASMKPKKAEAKPQPSQTTFHEIAHRL